MTTPKLCGAEEILIQKGLMNISLKLGNCYSTLYLHILLLICYVQRIDYVVTSEKQCFRWLNINMVDISLN